MEHFVFVGLSLLMCTSHSALAADPQERYSREQLQPLTKFRQQHQRTIDGRLCAAAFVQNRKAYTACTDAPSPSGVSGRPWCYVEPQVDAPSSILSMNIVAAVRGCQLLGDAAAWNYCGNFLTLC